MNNKPNVRHWSEFDKRAKEVIAMMVGCKANMVYVPLTDTENKKVEHFVNKKVVEKMKEKIHQKDHNQEHKRSATGQSGELAVEKHFGIPFTEWTVGHSKKYAHADLALNGYNLGVKCATLGNAPLVSKDPKRAEIICIKYDDNTVIICGIATPEMLKKYSDETYRKDPNATHKTAFIGFEHLLPCRILEDLAPFKNN